LGLQSTGGFKTCPIASAAAGALPVVLLATTGAFGAVLVEMITAPPLGAASRVCIDEGRGSDCSGRRGGLATLDPPADCGALALADIVIVSPLATFTAWPLPSTRSLPSFVVTITSPFPAATSPRVLNPETGTMDMSPTFTRTGIVFSA